MIRSNSKQHDLIQYTITVFNGPGCEAQSSSSAEAISTCWPRTRNPRPGTVPWCPPAWQNHPGCRYPEEAAVRTVASHVNHAASASMPADARPHGH